MNKNMIGMLLAGGFGNRLYPLTKTRAKPAVPFGGKYKIIDFTLSNCANSGVDTVGILTQYQPLELNTYIGGGGPWDLDRMEGGAHILSPFTAKEGGEWYKGTANAIFQNLNFVEQFSPEFVLILSGDHIYKMDYSALLESHKKSGSATTIAVIDVPLCEASRFGIMTCDENDRIVDFAEKPQNPTSTLASMGVYIFGFEALTKYLTEDALDVDSSHDFGKDIIPKMLKNDEYLNAYKFGGYWKDVGTLDNLFEANMDLLDHSSALNMRDPLWRIYSRHFVSSPHFVSSGAKIINSAICEGCKIFGTIEKSVLSSKVKVEFGASVKSSIVCQNSKILQNAKVNHAIVDEDVVIGEGAKINGEKNAICIIGRSVKIAPGRVVGSGEIVEGEG